MTVANTFASKALVAVVAAAMIFSAFVAPAKAATAEELQKMINDLMAQMNALQGQGGTSSSVASGVCPFTWTRDLKTGASGADVMKLQQFLNANADTRVAASGAGSVGAETEFFGPATAAAVSKFQVMHRADILTPAGLTNPTGFFGPSTRAKVNALCVAGGATDEDEDEDGETESGDLSGEASFEEAELDAASDDTIEEGAEDAEIAEFTVSFEEGDASISRLDVMISSTSVDNWDVLDTVSLWVDGDMVADMDASDEDEYQSDDKTLRFTGLDIVAMEDEDLDITIAATLQNNIDSEDLGEFEVDVVGMRWFDADGVAETETNVTIDVDAVEFTIEEAGSEDEIIVKTSSNDPEAATLQLEDDEKSDFMHVFSFDIDTDDSTNDIELNEVVVNVATTGATYSALVDDAELEIDGTTIDDVTVTADGNGAVLTFDVDGDVTIDAGDRVEAKLMLRFKALATEGATIEASIAAGAIEGEGAEDETSTGAAGGDAHTLRSTGVDVALDSTDADATVVDGNDNDFGTYVITLDVTAFDQDVFIPINSASTTWELVDGNGTALVVPAASTTVIVDSSAEEGGTGDAFFEINEGETETVTITVTYTPGILSPITARLQLLSLTFDETGTATGADDSTWSALPANTYRTSVISIQN